MKKLLLSLAALAFATLLFSQDDSKDNKGDASKDAVVKIENGFKSGS